MLAAVLAAAPPVSAAPDARIPLSRGDMPAAWRSAADALEASDRPVRAAITLTTAAALLDRIEEARGRVRAREERDPGRDLPAIADGVAAHAARRHEEAAALLDEALRRLESRGDPETTAVREELAFTLQDGGRWREALLLHERNAHSDDPLVALAADYGAGYCSLQAEEYARADSLMHHVVDEATRRDLPLLLGDAEALLGTLRWIDLDVDALLERLERALGAYERAGRASRQASCLRRIAATNLARGDIPRALRQLHRARDLALQAGDGREASFCLEHLGSARRDLGDDEAALAEWRAALEEGGDAWPPAWRSGTLENIGAAEARRGDFEAALGSFARARDELARTEGRWAEPSLLHRMALCLEKSGHPDAALRRLDEAVALARELELAPPEAAALIDAGELHVASGRLDEAERALTRAEELAGTCDVPALGIALHSAWAALLRARGDATGALARLVTAMELAETVRWRSRGATAVREQAFGRHERLWSRAIDTLAELGGAAGDEALAARAFDVAQRAKARSFLDLLAEAGTRARSRTDPVRAARERRLLEELARLDGEAVQARGDGVAREIRRVEEELEVLESEARESDPRWATLVAPPPVSAGEAASLIDPDEVILEYWLGEEASWLWILTRGSLRMALLPPRDAIERDVRALLPLLRDYNLLGPDPAYFVPPARRLSTVLLDPARSELEAAHRVTVLPHGILHYLPFEALLLPGATATPTRFAEVPWLVGPLDVSYLPALGLRRYLASVPADSSAATELLLIGDPVPAAGVAPLLGSAYGGLVPTRASFDREVEGLAVAFRGGPVQRAQGVDATVAALHRATSAGSRRLVHLTAHGVLNERRPRFSGILLTPDPSTGDDGFLTVDEVLALDLPCEQVVLSACSTALGREATGEGLVGLARAFFCAGARSVVAALWEVPSDPTTRLMIDFYRGIGPAGDRRHALAEAKRAAIRSGAAPREVGIDPAHPALWSGFVMIGSGE